MLTLNEYLKISKQFIKKHGYAKMINDDDAIAYVANYLMVADNRYNNKFGNIEGFRAMYGKYGIKNWIARYYKNKNKHVVNMSEEMESAIKSSENVFGNIEFNELHDYIQTLPEVQRDTIHMYFYEEKTLREIGKVYGITPEAVRLRLKVILKHLKEKFND